MPDIRVNAHITLQVSRNELRLIGLGLAGKLREEDIEPAAELNRTIMDSVANEAGTMYGALQNAADHAAGRPPRFARGGKLPGQTAGEEVQP